jgi:thioredoxin-related protein
MKKLLFLILAASGALFALPEDTASALERLTELPPVADPRMAETTLEAVYDAGASFEQLARPGGYTVIDVTAEHCAPCKQLDERWSSFLTKRPDVAVLKVTAFSGQISFSSVEEGDRWAERQDAMRDAYDVASTPHIVIFDGDGEVVAADDGSDKAGLELLRAWMDAEG